MGSPNNNERRKKISNFLIFAAVSFAFIIIIIMLVSSLLGDTDIAVNNNADDQTPTPYATEVITPFYTPTKAPTKAPVVTNTPAPTKEPQSTSTVVPLSLDEIYKKGDEGEEIEIIQKMLIEMGFDPGEADGDFGSSLKSAVENFQLYEGLDDDGIIGPSTMSIMISDWQEMMPKDLAADAKLKGKVIGIDAGHQKSENNDTEPMSPGSSETRAKASDGTYGRWTDAKEYVINLQIALKLKQELEALGATVIMTRETNDVNISNAERAQMMNNSNVDCWVRIYANGDDSKSKKGMIMLVPKEGCMDTTDDTIYEKSDALSDSLLTNTVKSTGAKNLGTVKIATLAGFNWSKVPVCLIELGYLTNEVEDKLLVTKTYQQKIVDGLVDGFIEYFASN